MHHESGRRRPLIAAVAVGTILAGGSVAAATGWLEIFRTDQVAPVEVSGDDVAALAELPDLLAAQTTVLLTLALLLSTVVSPMASGMVAVGIFGATWVAGVVGAIAEVFGNETLARVGSVSRVLLPTDGLWRGAMNAFQDPGLLTRAAEAFGGHPFLSETPLSPAFLGWVALWVALVLTLAEVVFRRRDV
ncbi:hypothetical protein [Isoptericola variabilis]|uniref:Uncharacterized protein n=1 Tax=Isoptericola variabilis (strain 225) TaxID=743718 RepID=F6FWH2_ISOV2|nr:hypothetical protein [Isoptericola variabilis]AEG44546.1 hypothetical protein Isova_1800 [Isoptericola variabilis 225]TWH26537.1 hypothetical protein L600_000600000170 [Isoptericola variabilis J7]